MLTYMLPTFPVCCQEDTPRPGAPGQGPRPAGAPAAARTWEHSAHPKLGILAFRYAFLYLNIVFDSEEDLYVLVSCWLSALCFCQGNWKKVAALWKPFEFLLWVYEVILLSVAILFLLVLKGILYLVGFAYLVERLRCLFFDPLLLLTHHDFEWNSPAVRFLDSIRCSKMLSDVPSLCVLCFSIRKDRITNSIL